MVAKKKDGVPARRDVIWIECNPQAGRETPDLHPFLVLSPQKFNARTSLVIGLPMTSAEYNADNPFAVAAGKAKGKTGKTSKTSKTSFVLCHQPKSFDWRVRNAKPRPLRKLGTEPFAQACAVLEQIMQLTAPSAGTK